MKKPMLGLPMLSYQLSTAWRSLWRRPGFSLSVILTMGLTLSILLTASRLFDHLVLQPLPYPASAQLYKVEQQQIDSTGMVNVNAYGYAGLMHLYQQQRLPDAVFSSVGLAHYDDEVLASHQAQPKLATAYVSADFFQTLAAKVQLGQLPDANSDPEQALASAVLSAASWQTLFNADPKVIGQTLSIRGQPYKIVAVLASDFIEPELYQAGRQTAIWLPWQFNPVPASTRQRFGDRSNPRIFIGRLKAELSAEQANSSLTALMDQSWQQQTASIPFYQGWRVQMQLNSFRQVIFGNSTQTAYLMLACALGLLLIASCNIANLLLSRAAERQKELAVSAALGAAPAQLHLAIFSEIALLMLCAALAGWGFSLLAVPWLQHYLPDVLPLAGFQPLHISTLLLALLLMLFLAAMLAFACSKLLNYQQLQSQLASGSKGGARQIRSSTRQILVYSQVAISGSLLLLNFTFLFNATRLMQDPAVFPTSQLVSLEVRLNSAQPLAPAQYSSLLSDLTSRLAQLPMVAGVSRAMSPQQQASNTWSLVDLASNQTVLPQAQIVDEHFFQVTQQPLVAGQDFSPQQIKTGANVLIINDVLAQSLYPNGSALGQQLSFDASAGAESAFTIIGVVKGLKKPGTSTVPPRVYRPLHSGNSFILAVKDGQQLDRLQVQRALAQVSPLLLIYQFEALSQQQSQLLQGHYLTAIAALILTILSMVLTAVGLYGVIHYHVQLRRQEIGIRLALGANNSRIVRLLLRDHSLPLGIGLLSSVGLVFAISDQLQPQLQQILNQQWPLLLALTITLLGALSLLALLLPLRSCLQQNANQLIHQQQQGH